MFWEDDISKKLTEAGKKNTALAWKVSNLFSVPAVLSIVALALGVILLVFAASATFFLGHSSSTDAIKGIFPILSLLLFILAGILYVLFVPVYCILVAAISFDFGDVAWGAANLILGVSAPFYKYSKAREIREKGLGYPEKADAPQKL